MKFWVIPLACTFLLAGCLVEVDLEDEKSVNDLEVMCREGDDYSCVQLGTEFKETHDYFSAVRAYEKACDGGNRDGCREAARLLFEGEYNLKQSLPEAKKYAEKGCKLGDLVSCDLERSVSVIQMNRNRLKPHHK